MESGAARASTTPLLLPIRHCGRSTLRGGFAGFLVVASVPTIGGIVGDRQLRDPLAQGIVCVRALEHHADGLQALRDRECRAPLVQQDVQTNLTRVGNVAMVHRCLEGDIRRSHRVCFGDDDVENEDAVLEGRILRALDESAPEVQVVVRRENMDALAGMHPNIVCTTGHLFQLAEQPPGRRGISAVAARASIVLDLVHAHNLLLREVVCQADHTLHLCSLGDALLADGAEVPPCGWTECRLIRTPSTSFQ
mmetsp:Transcript_49771/g.142915  ORF Transcript_49771/g.142915 Transcript_49771/m.142915 type:complete len:251 (+) Transcript_49771:253-1005(+)